jgi:hypothetical protein
MAVLNIRRYQETDFEAAWHLHVLALQRAGVFIGNGPWDDDVRSIEQVYLNNQGEFLVGIYEDKIIAIGAFRKVDEERAEIKM